MRTGRTLAILALLIGGLLHRAAPAADVFLERFRVGAYREAAALAPDPRGWPRDLFPQPEDRTADRAAVASVLRDATDGAAEAPGARILSRIAPDEAAAVARAWAEARLRRLDAERDALAAWHEADYARAESLATALAEAAPAAEEAFIWALRAVAADEARYGIATLHPSHLWIRLIELGPFDSASGWAIWRARRTARDQPLLPAWIDERRSALWLAGIRDGGLVSRDLDASGFAPDLKAALGAAVLPVDQLARHFGLYPEPPSDARLAELWARGRQRQDGFAVATTEALGASPQLPARVRAGLLRKAADRRLTSLQWQEGRDALTAAVDLAAAADVGWLRRSLRAECRRAEALARHRGRPADALHFAALQGRLGEEDPLPDGVSEWARSLVRRGDAPDIGTRPAPCDRGVRERVLADLWPVWAAWGTRLCGDGYAWYRDALQPVAAAAAPEQRRLAAERAVATVLARTGGGHDLLGWALELDLERAGNGERDAAPSAVPELIREAPAVRIHAALGLCLLAGDPRGQLACVYALPRAGLTWEQNRLFLYPLPSRDAIVDLLAADPDPALALAVARNESLFDPGVRSRSGALGWMQIMPFHYAGDGVEEGRATWRVPAASVGKGLALLAQNARRYGGDPYRAVAAYNAGPGAVTRWDEQLGGAPDRATFLAWIGYPETHRYTEKVLIDREVYAHILGSYRREEPSAP